MGLGRREASDELAAAHIAAEVAAVVGEPAPPGSSPVGAPAAAQPAGGTQFDATPEPDPGRAEALGPQQAGSGVRPTVAVLEPPAPSPGNAPAQRRRRWRFRHLRYKRIAFVLVGAYLAWLLFLAAYAAISRNQVEALAPNAVADTPGTVWLMVGSDSREGLTAAERRKYKTGGDVGDRTDTIMLLHMDALGAPTLVSIPRDSWVSIPAHTNSAGEPVAERSAKINAAFAEGGAPLLSQTIEANTGLHVDHYAQVGFGGIVDLTNAVGGIEVCFDEAIDDVKSGLKVKAGCQTLNGRKALAYVRMRYSDQRGDLGRVERQQQFVSSVMGKVASLSTVVNPVRQWRIVNAAVDSLTVDQHAQLWNVARLGVGLGQIAMGSGEVTTVPSNDSDHWAGGQWVLRWDQAESDRLWQSLGAPPRTG